MYINTGQKHKIILIEFKVDSQKLINESASSIALCKGSRTTRKGNKNSPLLSCAG